MNDYTFVFQSAQLGLRADNCVIYDALLFNRLCITLHSAQLGLRADSSVIYNALFFVYRC